MFFYYPVRYIRYLSGFATVEILYLIIYVMVYGDTDIKMGHSIFRTI